MPLFAKFAEMKVYLFSLPNYVLQHQETSCYVILESVQSAVHDFTQPST